MRSAFGHCGLMILAALPVGGVAMPAGGTEPLRLSVTPAHAFAPATVQIRARIEPSAENRTLAIVADGPSFYRSSEIQLDGDQAPKTIELRFSNLPDGEYEIYAVLADRSGRQRAVARQSTRVISLVGGH